MSAFSLAIPGNVGVATGEPKSVEPSGPEVLNRTENPLPDLNTLSGRSSPLRSTRANWPSVLVWVKPTLPPALPYLSGLVGLNPAYRWPPVLVDSEPDSALAL